MASGVLKWWFFHIKESIASKPMDTIVKHHSDRGIQYCSTEYEALLQKGTQQSLLKEN